MPFLYLTLHCIPTYFLFSSISPPNVFHNFKMSMTFNPHLTLLYSITHVLLGLQVFWTSCFLVIFNWGSLFLSDMSYCFTPLYVMFRIIFFLSKQKYNEHCDKNCKAGYISFICNLVPSNSWQDYFNRITVGWSCFHKLPV